jgi:hypothetical protein
MPQPYLAVKPGGNGPFQFAPGVINKYPELVAKIGLVTSNWAKVDAEVQLTLVGMLGTSADLVAAIYRQIQAALSRDALIQAVAEEKLSGEELDLFHIIWKLSQSPNKQRNKIAHGVWGIADDIPDALIMVNPLDSLERQAKVWAMSQQQFLHGLPANYNSIPALTENMMVYRKNDFDALDKEIIQVCQYWNLFRGRLSIRSIDRQFPEGLGEWLQLLTNQPPIRAALDKLAQDRQNGSSTV